MSPALKALAHSADVVFDRTVSGSIKTINDAVMLQGLDGLTCGLVDVRGTYTATGGLALQGTVDGVNWITLNTSLINETTGVLSSTIPSGSTGAWSFASGLYVAMRIVALGAVTGSAVLTMRIGTGSGIISIDSPLPTGSNLIGGFNLAQINGTAPNYQDGTNGNSLGTCLTKPAYKLDKTATSYTASGTTGPLSDDFGQAISCLVNVSTATGTNPTLDLTLQGSLDNGTTFQDIYQFPRITATGFYSVPMMLFNGIRKWVWTIGGTTPSFMLSFMAMRGSNAPGIIRNFYDRTLNTAQALNAVTASYNVEGCDKIMMVVSSAAATTACVMKMQGSNDGAHWFDLNAALTSVANSDVAVAGLVGLQCKYVRGIVTTAGATQTLNYVNFHAMG